MGTWWFAMGFVMLIYPLVNCHTTMEHGHRDSWFSLLNMVILQSYVSLPEGIPCWPYGVLPTNHPFLIGGLEHFLFFHILGITITIDFHIFQRGGSTTNQKHVDPSSPNKDGGAWQRRCSKHALDEHNLVFLRAVLGGIVHLIGGWPPDSKWCSKWFHNSVGGNSAVGGIPMWTG